MGMIERTVYFRAARVFSWMLMLAAGAALVYSATTAVVLFGDLFGKQPGATKEEVKAYMAISNGSMGRAKDEIILGEKNLDPSEESDPKLIGELETELAHLVLMFPSEFRISEGGDENIRKWIKKEIQEKEPRIIDQLRLVQESRQMIGQFEPQERLGAFSIFLRINYLKLQKAEEIKEVAKQDLKIYGGAVFASAILIMLVSMVLVLLTIERNTRPQR
jgi:hypothetical protein